MPAALSTAPTNGLSIPPAEYSPWRTTLYRQPVTNRTRQPCCQLLILVGCFYIDGDTFIGLRQAGCCSGPFRHRLRGRRRHDRNPAFEFRFVPSTHPLLRSQHGMQRTKMVILPCIDSSEIAASRQLELDIARSAAAALGKSAARAARDGYYLNKAGEKVDWRLLVRNACAAKEKRTPPAIAIHHSSACLWTDRARQTGGASPRWS
jgi:hypothetical protein